MKPRSLMNEPLNVTELRERCVLNVILHSLSSALYPSSSYAIEWHNEDATYTQRNDNAGDFAITFKGNFCAGAIKQFEFENETLYEKANNLFNESPPYIKALAEQNCLQYLVDILPDNQERPRANIAFWAQDNNFYYKEVVPESFKENRNAKLLFFSPWEHYAWEWLEMSGFEERQEFLEIGANLTEKRLETWGASTSWENKFYLPEETWKIYQSLIQESGDLEGEVEALYHLNSLGVFAPHQKKNFKFWAFKK